MSNPTEEELIKALHKKRKLEPRVEAEFQIFQQLLPALREAIRSGGGAEALLKKSGALAAYKIVQLMSSDKEEIALKAAEKVVSYDIGKPVERSVNIYGDISNMNEADLDNQILQLMGRTGARKLLETTQVLPKQKKIKQKRKPRKDELIIDAEASVREEHAQGVNTPAEARALPESQE